QVDSFMVDVTDELAKRLERARPEAIEQVRKGIIDRIGALSFSEDWSNLLMWAHYAQQHEGIVVEFDAMHSSLNSGTAGEFGHLRPVKYEGRRPQLTMAQTEGADVFLSKSDVWEYEREWRILQPLDRLAPVAIDPANRPVFVGQLDPECVKGV